MSSKYRIIPFGGGGGGITPTGTLEIRSEGIFDVTDYASVDVDIFDDTTTKTITNNGTYNSSDDHVLGYSQVTVAVPASAVDTGTLTIEPITQNVTLFTQDVTGYRAVAFQVAVPASAVDSGTKQITANGSNQDVVGYAAVDVAVIPVLQNKTVTPTTSQQTVEKDSGQGYDGLGTVTINGVTSAIDANIIASNIRDGVTILGVTGTYTGGAMIDPQDFLQFYSPAGAQISLGPYDAQTDAEIYYSKDPTIPTAQWTRWQFDGGISDSIELNSGETVYLYGNNPAGLPYSNIQQAPKFRIQQEVECHGNIMSILSLEDKDVVSAGAFGSLFSGTKITTLPELPATTVGRYAYERLFENCTALSSIPTGYSIGASNVHEGGLQSMFAGCTNLTSVPSGFLNTTVLGGSACHDMFYGCTRLASVPSDLLSATNIGPGVYEEMFMDCSALTQSPALPATVVPSGAYASMFFGCSSLTTIGNISATTLTGGANMEYMFKDCTSLTNISLILPANIDTQYLGQFQGMFSGCNQLAYVSPNMLPATSLGTGTYSEMFYGCSSLIKSPRLTATVLGDSCYDSMFSQCTSLDEIELYFADNAQQQWYDSQNDYYPYSNGWVEGVGSVGVFKNYGNANIPVNSQWGATNGIPYGWTVQTVDYFYIKNEDTQDLTFTLNTPNYDYSSTDLAWSKDMSTWTQFTKGSSTTQTVPLLQGENLYLRSSTGFAKYYQTFSPITLSCNGLFSAHGDLRTLIDYTDVSSVTSLPAGAFYRMFYDAGNLTEIDCTLNGVTTIGAISFGEFAARVSSGDTNLTRVRIWMPDVTTVNGSSQGHAGTQASFYDAFYFRSALQEITVPNLQTWDNTAFVSWMYGVNSTGTAYVPTGVTIPSNANGIPANWTRVNY